MLSVLFELADQEFRQIRDETEAGLQLVPDESTAQDVPAKAAVLAQDGYVRGKLNAFTFLKIANQLGCEAVVGQSGMEVQEVTGSRMLV